MNATADPMRPHTVDAIRQTMEQLDTIALEADANAYALAESKRVHGFPWRAAYRQAIHRQFELATAYVGLKNELTLAEAREAKNQ